MKKTRKMLELEERLGEDLGEYLKREYIENWKSAEEIGKSLGVYYTTIMGYLNSYKIPIKNSSELRLPKGFISPTKEQLEKLYINERRGQKEIGKILGISSPIVVRFLKKFNIHIRDISEAKLPPGFVKPTREQLYQGYIIERKNASQIAKKLRTNGKTIIRYLKKEGIPLRTASESRLPFGLVIPTKEQLEKEYKLEKRTIDEIAEIYGVGSTTVTRWLKRNKIHIRTSTEFQLPEGVVKPTKEQLYQKYIIEGKTIEQIALELGTTKGTISRWVNETGIKTRSREEYAYPAGFVKPTRNQLYKWYVVERRSPQKIANQLGISTPTVRSLLTKNKINMRSISEAKLPEGCIKPNRKQLYQWYIKECREIGKISNMLKVSRTSVSNWLRDYSIPARTPSEIFLSKRGIKKPTREELYTWYICEGNSTVEIGNKIGVSHSCVRRWLEEAGIQIRGLKEAIQLAKSKHKIISSKQFMELLKKDSTAANLAAVAVSLNGQAKDVEKIIESVYEGRFKDREQLHNLIQDNREQIYGLIRDGLTNLGPYLGDFSLHERRIFPVLMGDIIAHIPEDKVSSLEDRFIRLLRHNYSSRFNLEPDGTLAEIKGKVNSLEGRRKGLYEKLEEHYERVLKLKEELS